MSARTMLDLFAGTHSWAHAFGDWRTFAVELDEDFEPDVVADVSQPETWRPHVDEWLDGQRLDLLVASPPCNSFSTGTMGRMWTHEGLPKHPTAELGQRLVLATLHAIAYYRPRAFVIENPRARLGSLELLAGIPSAIVWQCHVGKPNAKPTQLWYGGLQLDDDLCHNRRPEHPSDCCCTDHNAAPRGSYTGTQGSDSVEAGMIPPGMSAMVREAFDTNR